MNLYIVRCRRLAALAVGVALVASCGSGEDSVDRASVDSRPGDIQTQTIAVAANRVRVETESRSEGGLLFAIAGGLGPSGDGSVVTLPVSIVLESLSPTTVELSAQMEYRLDANSPAALTNSSDSLAIILNDADEASVIVSLILDGTVDEGVWQFVLKIPYRRDIQSEESDRTASFEVTVTLLSEARGAELGPFCAEAVPIYRQQASGQRVLSLQARAVREASASLPAADQAVLLAAVDELEEALAAARTQTAIDGYSSDEVVQIMSEMCGTNELISFGIHGD